MYLNEQEQAVANHLMMSETFSMLAMMAREVPPISEHDMDEIKHLLANFIFNLMIGMDHDQIEFKDEEVGASFLGVLVVCLSLIYGSSQALGGTIENTKMN
jgi:hypothetical protein